MKLDENTFNLKLYLQSVDLSDTCVPFLIDKVHLSFLNPPLALGVTETIRDLFVLVALGDRVIT